MNKRVGLHIRLERTVTEVIEHALRLQLPFFQSFCVLSEGGYLQLTDEDRTAFLGYREKFGNLYLHGGFWVNLCSTDYDSLRFARKELLFAKRLGYTHYIIHPGAATAKTNKETGIDNLARALNKLLRNQPEITVVLENTTHSNLTIGTDLNDFVALKEKLDYPVKFCLDTAHAYSAGYDLVNKQEEFFALVEATMGFDNIALIHLNDTQEPCGSHVDQHAEPGTGNLGGNLASIVNHPQLIDKPIILELPHGVDEQAALQKVGTWIT